MNDFGLLDKEAGHLADQIFELVKNTHPANSLAALARVHTSLCIQCGICPQIMKEKVYESLYRDYALNWEKYIKEIDK